MVLSEHDGYIYIIYISYWYGFLELNLIFLVPGSLYTVSITM